MNSKGIMESDWFFANTELIRATERILNSVQIPIFTSYLHEYVVDFTQLTIIDTIDHYRQGNTIQNQYSQTSSSSSSSSSNVPMQNLVVYKALYKGKIVFAEIWNPLTFQDQLAIMTDLSIQRTLPSHQFVPMLGAGYFKILNNTSKILILKDCNEVRWKDYVKSESLTWNVRLRLALELTNALFYLHSHNLTIRDFSLDSAFINPDSSVRLDGCYEVNALPFNNAVDVSRRRKSLISMQSYNVNIQQYGQFLQILLEEKLPDGDTRVRYGCPERFQALMEWCTDEEPLLLPTILDCLNEMESICRDHLPPIFLPSPPPHVVSCALSPQNTRNHQYAPHTDKAMSKKQMQQSIGPFDNIQETPPKQDSSDVHIDKKSILKSLNHKLHRHSPSPVFDNGINGSGESTTLFTDTYARTAADTLTGVDTAVEFAPLESNEYEITADETGVQIDAKEFVNKKSLALNLLSKTSDGLMQIDNKLLEYIENLRNPFSDLSQDLEDISILNTTNPMDDTEDDSDLDKSIEGFQYLELILALYDRLGHIKQLVDQVAKMSFSPRVYEFIYQSLEVQLTEGLHHTEDLLHASGAVGLEDVDAHFTEIDREDVSISDKIEVQETDSNVDESFENLEFKLMHHSGTAKFHSKGLLLNHELQSSSMEDFEVEFCDKEEDNNRIINPDSVETMSIGIQTDHIEDIRADSVPAATSAASLEDKFRTEVEVQTSAQHDDEVNADTVLQKPMLTAKKPAHSIKSPSMSARSTPQDSPIEMIESAAPPVSSVKRINVPRLELSSDLSLTPDPDITIVSSSYSEDSDVSRPHSSVNSCRSSIGDSKSPRLRSSSEDKINQATAPLSVQSTTFNGYPLLETELSVSVPASSINDEHSAPANIVPRPLSKVQEAAKAIEMKAKNSNSRHNTPSRNATPRVAENAISNKALTPREHGQMSHHPPLSVGVANVNERSDSLPDQSLITTDKISGSRRPSSTARAISETNQEKNSNPDDHVISIGVEEQKQSQPSNTGFGGIEGKWQLHQPSVCSKPDKPADDKCQAMNLTESNSSMPPLQLKSSNSFIMRNFNKPILENTNKAVPVEELVIGDRVIESSSEPSSPILVVPSSPTPPTLGRGGMQGDFASNHSTPSTMPPVQPKGSPLLSGGKTIHSNLDQVPTRSTPSPSMGPPFSSAKAVLKDSASMFLDSIRKLDSFYGNGDGVLPSSNNEVSPSHVEQTAFHSPYSSGSVRPSTAHNRSRELSPPFSSNERYARSSPSGGYSPFEYLSSSERNPNELNTALSSFLQIVQRCSATSNRAKELIDNMDRKVLNSSQSPKRSPESGINFNSPGYSGMKHSNSIDWSHTNASMRSSPYEDRARTYSPTTHRTITSAHYSGRVYSSPERTRLTEESRRKAALQAGQLKASTINTSNKLSHEKNAIAYSISPKSSSKSPVKGRLDWSYR